MRADVYQQFQSSDSLAIYTTPEPITIPALPLSAQINLENAARLRAMLRTSRIIPLLPGGSAAVADLGDLCEHCGQTAGKAHVAPHTRRTVHLCGDCAALDRQVAAATNGMFEAFVRRTPGRARPPMFRGSVS